MDCNPKILGHSNELPLSLLNIEMIMTALRSPHLGASSGRRNDASPCSGNAMRCEAMRCDAESTLSTDPDWSFGLVVVSKPGHRLVENGERASFFRETL